MVKYSQYKAIFQVLLKSISNDNELQLYYQKVQEYLVLTTQTHLDTDLIISINNYIKLFFTQIASQQYKSDSILYSDIYNRIKNLDISKHDNWSYQLLRLIIDSKTTDERLILLVTEILAQIKMPGFARQLKIYFDDNNLLNNKNTELKLKHDIIKNLTQSYRNIVFYNLANSGASAIDPILREILYDYFYYDILGGPHSSPYFNQFAHNEIPLYHWTHNDVSSFYDYLNSSRYCFLCLYRDPRDVLVSRICDASSKIDISHITNEQFMEAIDELYDSLEQADLWISNDNSNIFKFRFEDMKKDVLTMLVTIFDVINIEIDIELLRYIYQKHSFESVTKRKRGETGDTVRTWHMYRKGISGDWKNYFTPSVSAYFNDKCGYFLYKWGYEQDSSWINN